MAQLLQFWGNTQARITMIAQRETPTDRENRSTCFQLGVLLFVASMVMAIEIFQGGQEQSSSRDNSVHPEDSQGPSESDSFSSGKSVESQLLL